MNGIWYGDELETLNGYAYERTILSDRLRQVQQEEVRQRNASVTELQKASAAFETHNPISSWYVQESEPDAPPVAGYSPFENDEIAGYEEHWSAFKESFNPMTTAVIKRNIDRERRNQKILNDAGAESVLYSVGAELANPINIALMALPIGAATKGFQAAKYGMQSAAASATAIGATEAALHATQETRTLEESMQNAITVAVIDGVLGFGVAKYLGRSVPADGFDEARVSAAQAIEDHVKSIGAAQAQGVTATGEVMVKGIPVVGNLTKFLAKATPAGRTLQSPDTTVRATVQELTENYSVLQDDYMPTAVETLFNLDRRKMDEATGFVRDFQRQAGLDDDQWNQALTHAMRNGDVSDNPMVQKAAETYRKQIDEIWDRAYEARVPGTFREVKGEDGLIEYEKIESKTAQSYLQRQYDLSEVRRNKLKFKQSWKEGIVDSVARNQARLKPLMQEAEAEVVATKTLNKQIKQASKVLDTKSYKNIQKSMAKLQDEIDALTKNKPAHFKRSIAAREKKMSALLEKEVALFKKHKASDVYVSAKGKMKATVGLRQAMSQMAKIATQQQKRQAKHLAGLKADYPTIPEDMDEVLEDIYKNVTNLRMGDQHTEVVSKSSSAFKQRADVQDSFLEDFLVKDAEELMDHYLRSVGSRARIAERFGDSEMTDQLARIENSYANRIADLEEAGDLKSANKLRKKMDNDINDVRAMRDRILGRNHQPMSSNPANQMFAQVGRTARALNTTTMLGSVLLSSIPDVGRYIMYNGMVPYVKAGYQALKNLKLNNLPKSDLARLTSASSRVSNARLNNVMDVQDGMYLSKAEKMGAWIADKSYLLGGLKHFDAYNKTLGGHLVADKLTSSILDGQNIGKLKSLGFDESTIAQMKAEMKQAGAMKEPDGLFNPYLDRWQNKHLIEKFEAAMVKEVDSLTVTPGAGDKPVIMDGELAKTLFQFKSFMLGATNRIMLPLAHGKAKDMASHLAVSTGLGILGYLSYEAAVGREPDMDINNLVAEGVDRSGLLGYGIEMINMQEKITGVGFREMMGGSGEASRYRSRDVVGSLLGPTMGTAQDITKTMMTGTSTDSRIHAMRKLIPMQNHFLIRKQLSALEAEIAKAAGGTGKYGTPQGRGTMVQGPNL